jgi:D-sedoheptulose 7-phosphate isomerase
MINNNFYSRYFEEFYNHTQNLDLTKIKKIEKLIIETSKKNKKVIICGNGGSAATSSHVSVDLTKNAKIKTINFNESDLITCFANDYGYENWCKEALNFYGDKGDLLILDGILILLKKSIRDFFDLSLSGCSRNNYLNSNKNNKVNIWINSNMYNVVESIHHLILLSIIDSIIEKNEKNI